MSDKTTRPNPARDAIFAKIRASLDVKLGYDARVALADTRISAHTRHLTPARALQEPAALRAHFTDYLTRGFASVINVPGLDQLPIAIETYLRDNAKPPRVRMGNDARLASLPWQSAPSIERLSGRADPADEVSLSYALAAAAETGTLVLASGPDNPVTLNYLPETHLVVLDAATLKGSYEDALDIVRAKLGTGVMPRTLNFISGPSRTSDIGGITVMGAHGPRFLAVFVIG